MALHLLLPLVMNPRFDAIDRAHVTIDTASLEIITGGADFRDFARTPVNPCIAKGMKAGEAAQNDYPDATDEEKSEIFAAHMKSHMDTCFSLEKRGIKIPRTL